MGELRPWHIIVLLAVVFVLFGYKKLPDATRSLGRSLRILKTEVKSLHDDEPETAAEQAPTAPRAVEAPRAAVPEASSPTPPPVTAGTPAAPKPPTSDAEHR
jgi:sec-independent protein translocase protein TatA